MSNAAGAVTSDVVTLTVLVPLSITAQPQGQSVFPYTNVTFAVGVGGTHPFYQWRFNGTNIAAGTVGSNAVDAATDAAYRAAGGIDGGTATNIDQNVVAPFTNHQDRTDNPHSTTAGQVGAMTGAAVSNLVAESTGTIAGASVVGAVGSASVAGSFAFTNPATVPAAITSDFDTKYLRVSIPPFVVVTGRGRLSSLQPVTRISLICLRLRSACWFLFSFSVIRR
jgi:hypothetical protein